MPNIRHVFFFATEASTGILFPDASALVSKNTFFSKIRYPKDYSASVPLSRIMALGLKEHLATITSSSANNCELSCQSSSSSSLLFLKLLFYQAVSLTTDVLQTL